MHTLYSIDEYSTTKFSNVQIHTLFRKYYTCIIINSFDIFSLISVSCSNLYLKLQASKSIIALTKTKVSMSLRKLKGKVLLLRSYVPQYHKIQLHWLPVSYRIRFKLCCLVHAIHYGRSPAYLMETVQSVGTSRSRSGLRSSSTSSMDYSLPWLRTKFGERAFSHAGPATWNALPDHIRTVADPVKFRKLLKSLYFSQAFNIC